MKFPQLLVSALAVSITVGNSSASIAYGTTNNFDVVNDTETECHGFEIEIEDCHSSEISYTYNYNHYGTSTIIEDVSDPTHPRCVVRWESAKDPDGSWASCTAIPSDPINPTNGHQFTNPNVTGSSSAGHQAIAFRSTSTTRWSRTSVRRPR